MKRSFKVVPGQGIVSSSSLWDEPEYSDNIQDFIYETIDNVICDVNDADWAGHYQGQAFRDKCKREMEKLLKNHGFKPAEIKSDAVQKQIVDLLKGYGEYSGHKNERFYSDL